MQAFAHHGRSLPRFQVTLCFGEEFPDPQRQRKLITAHVEPLLARQLYYFAQQNSGHFLRGYDLPEHISSPEDYHRSIRHSSIQEWKTSRWVILFHCKYLTLTRTADRIPSFSFEELGNGASVQHLRISARIWVENQLHLIDRWAYFKRKDGLQSFL